MKSIIPFKKDIIFKTNISEITSISLEHSLSILDDQVKGDFIISGEYKVTDSSSTVEPYEVTIPFSIIIDEKYDTKKAIIDIDDFYYEIKDDNILSISIDVLIDKLEEKPNEIIEELNNIEITREMLPDENKEVKEEILEKYEEKERICKPEKENIKEKADKIIDAKVDEEPKNRESITSLFSNSSLDETYSTYNVYIVKQEDDLQSILNKYNITEEELSKYNDITNIQFKDKLIIPYVDERTK